MKGGIYLKIFDDEKIVKILLGVIIFLLLVIISLLVFDYSCDEVVSDNVDEITQNVEDVETEKHDDLILQNKFFVEIKGAVKKAGVYEIDSGSRINDVIKLAGGVKSNASTEYINLSKKVTDEMVIYIYTKNQVKKMADNEEIKEDCVCPDVDITSCEGASVIVPSGSDTSNINSEQNVENDKVSINKASKEELMTLSGVGESKALAIIEYRTSNNGFKAIEDIMNVSGIGESLYNKIKDFITL